MEQEYLQQGSISGMHYRIIRLLGEGGYTRVYEAEDTKMNRRVALKQYVDAQFLEREIQNYQKLDGVIGIPSILDRYFEDGRAVLVMDLVDGWTIESWLALQDGGIADEKETYEIFRQVLLVLNQIHKQGMVHCDLGPDNLMIDREGYVKIIDFNAMKENGTENGEKAVQLKTGYSAYEQYFKDMQISYATDIHAAGAVLYRMLLGKTPGDARNPQEITGVNNERTGFILGMCLKQESTKRFQSVAALYNALFSENIETAVYEPVQIRKNVSTATPAENTSKTFTSAPVAQKTEEMVTVNPESSMNQEGTTAQKKSKKKAVIIGICAAVLIIAVAVTGIVVKTLREEDSSDGEIETETNKKDVDYEQAVLYLNQGQYDDAVDLFMDLGDYMDSYDYLYQIAERYTGSYQYGDAVEIYEYLGDYSDSLSNLKEIADGYLDNSKTEDAKDVYEYLSDYQDVKEDVKECDFRLACEKYDDGDYEKAKVEFEKLGSYTGKKIKKTAEEMVDECDYEIACEDLRNKKYDKYEEDKKIFQDREDYTTLYNMAQSYQDGGYYQEAIDLYLELQKENNVDYSYQIRTCQGQMLEADKYADYDESASKSYDGTLGTYLNHISAQDAESDFSDAYGTYYKEDGTTLVVAKATINDKSYGIKSIVVGSSTGNDMTAQMYYIEDKATVFAFEYDPDYEYTYLSDGNTYTETVQKITVNNVSYYSKIPK